MRLILPLLCVKKLYREKIYFVLRYALHHGAKRESDVKIL